MRAGKITVSGFFERFGIVMILLLICAVLSVLTP